MCKWDLHLHPERMGTWTLSKMWVYSYIIVGIWCIIIILDIILSNVYGPLFLQFYITFNETSFPIILLYLFLLMCSCCWGTICAWNLPLFLDSVCKYSLLYVIEYGISPSLLLLHLFFNLVTRTKKACLDVWLYKCRPMCGTIIYHKDVNAYFNKCIVSQLSYSQKRKYLLYLRCWFYTLINMIYVKDKTIYNEYSQLLDKLKLIPYHDQKALEQLYQNEFCEKFTEEWYPEYPTLFFSGLINSAMGIYIFVMIGVFTMYWSCSVYSYLNNDDYVGNESILIIFWICRDVLICLLCTILIYIHSKYHLFLELKERYSWIHSSVIETSMRNVDKKPKSRFYRKHKYAIADCNFASSIMSSIIGYYSIKKVLENIYVDQQWMVKLILDYIGGDTFEYDWIQTEKEGYRYAGITARETLCYFKVSIL